MTLGPEFGEDQGKTEVIGITSLIACTTWATIHVLLTLTSGINQWSALKAIPSTIHMSCYMLMIAFVFVTMPSKNYIKLISSLR